MTVFAIGNSRTCNTGPHPPAYYSSTNLQWKCFGLQQRRMRLSSFALVPLTTLNQQAANHMKPLPHFYMHEFLKISFFKKKRFLLWFFFMCDRQK